MLSDRVCACCSHCAMRLASNAPTATSKCAVRGPVAKFGVKRLGLEGVRRHRKRDETKNTIAHESSRDFGGEQCSTSRRVERQFPSSDADPQAARECKPQARTTYVSHQWIGSKDCIRHRWHDPVRRADDHAALGRGALHACRTRLHKARDAAWPRHGTVAAVIATAAAAD